MSTTAREAGANGERPGQRHRCRDAAPAARRRSPGDRRVARLARRRGRAGGAGARRLPAAPRAAARRRAAPRPARRALDRLRQHDPGRRRARLPRRRGAGAAPGQHRALERRGDRVAGQPPGAGAGRAHGLLRLRRRAVRGRLQPLLPRQGRRGARRPGVLPGSLVAGDLRPRLPRGPPVRGAARPVPPGRPRGRAPLLPAPPAAARLLGVPDGIDGPGRDQRDLPGPVRGNGKIIQELESLFWGAGWNVVKVVWGRRWDELLARDSDGVLLDKLDATPDGQWQTLAASDAAYVREKLFDSEPLRKLIDGWSDEDVVALALDRGGHDLRRVHAAFAAAVATKGRPTVILAHTVKGRGLGREFEARNATHQMKKFVRGTLSTFRDRLGIDVPDEAIEKGYPPYYRPPEDSDVHRYLMERRQALGGPLPRRVVRDRPLALPGPELLARLKHGSGNQEVATTMALVRLVKDLLRDKEVGRRIVPIIPDEARTFGMDSLFPSLKIYSPNGMNYDAVDRDLVLSYKEDVKGRIMHEGISEAGSMASFHAAGSSYATFGEPMIPLYIFYSMFGFQRTGASMWSAGDQRCRGFLVGATAGRTTLNGEGLQHQDGHSLLVAATNPACVAYDPSFAFEIPVIVADALRRMYGEQPEDVFYYLTVYNEPFVQPPMPEGLDEELILAGLYRYSAAERGHAHRAHVLASGSAMPLALEAQRLLAAEFDVALDVWSAPGWQRLRAEALACESWNRMHPAEDPRTPYVTRVFEDEEGPIVAVSDWVKEVPEQIARWMPGPYAVLGTDGYGRSDTRKALRRHFRIDPQSIAVAVLYELSLSGTVKRETVADAINRFGLDPEATTEVP